MAEKQRIFDKYEWADNLYEPGEEYHSGPYQAKQPLIMNLPHNRDIKIMEGSLATVLACGDPDPIKISEPLVIKAADNYTITYCDDGIYVNGVKEYYYEDGVYVKQNN